MNITPTSASIQQVNGVGPGMDPPHYYGRVIFANISSFSRGLIFSMSKGRSLMGDDSLLHSG